MTLNDNKNVLNNATYKGRAVVSLTDVLESGKEQTSVKKVFLIERAIFLAARDTDQPSYTTLIRSLNDWSNNVLEAALGTTTSKTELSGCLIRVLLSLQRAELEAILTDEQVGVLAHALVEVTRDVERVSTPRLDPSFFVGIPRPNTEVTVAFHETHQKTVIEAPSNDRHTKIREVLKSKEQVSIKDISNAIPGVSEKTLQRDLMALIERGEVVREGERRWSTYRLA